ncbi:CpaF family protein [Egicoccus sp. AB-alg2]|uniref:CpaF family protein n=1 Tax=Egicoccus sp. AB-alg2 TaxID=3242693 RepID=UPI00359E2AA3
MSLKDRVSRRHDLGVALEKEDATDAITRFRAQLLREADLDALARLDATQLRARLERIAGNLLNREGPVISAEQRATLIRQIVDEMIGLGVLEPLLADESVTEIMVNGYDDIWVERGGRLARDEDLRFASEAQLYQTIDRIVGAVNRRVDESSPMVDARLPSGERVNVIIPPLSLKGPCLTIRRFPTPYTMAQLIGLGSLDEPLAQLLASLVRAKLNVIVSGGTGTGKTTFLNALSSFIPPEERIITVEDAAELQLQQPHVITLESRPPNVEGRGQVTIRDLVRNSLRMRPDRIIVGEVRGGETLDMLQAMNTGHEGSLATVHANSPEDAVLRLETLASMTELSISFEALRDQINSAIDVFVQLTRAADGTRRVAEVALVTSSHREPFRLATVSAFVPDPWTEDGRSTGRYLHAGLPSAVRHRLHQRGLRVPEAFDRDLSEDAVQTVEVGR